MVTFGMRRAEHSVCFQPCLSIVIHRRSMLEKVKWEKQKGLPLFWWGVVVSKSGFSQEPRGWRAWIFKEFLTLRRNLFDR